MNMQEIVSSFQSKYNFPAIWEVAGNEELELIYVYTSDAKVWVDLPSYYEGFEVKMVVGRKARPTKSPN